MTDFFNLNWNGTQAEGFRPFLSVAQYEPEQELSDYEPRITHAKPRTPAKHLMRNFTYLVWCNQTKVAAIIDPQTESFHPESKMARDIQNAGLTVEYLLLTHTHWDHVTGLEEALHQFKNAKVYLHRRDFSRIEAGMQKALGTEANQRIVFFDQKQSQGKLEDIYNQPVVKVGKLVLYAIHTPGHSPGEICYFLPSTPEQQGYLFSGDTLFIEDCGRTDFPDSSNEEMFISLTTLKTLPLHCILLPGHHYRPNVASLMEKEFLKNPALQCKSVEDLIALP